MSAVALELIPVAAAAGWIDAVVGGGGLLQLPAMLIAFPHLPTATVLGTNKAVAITGTSSAATTYLRKTDVDWSFLGLAAAVALPAAAGGALVATALPSSVFRPVIMIALLAVGAFVTLRPDFGRTHTPVRLSRRKALTAALLCGGGIGFYDGVIGSGTGTFLIIAFLLVLGADFVHGSAMAKVVNVGTNLGALIVFVVEGHVMWLTAAAMAVGNVTGGALGARMALKRGASFIRYALMVVVVALVAKLGYDQWG
ncbi:TSUP family transporter [Streptomyces sp. PTM05]|uniref:Probable membrane transporter protein n=1 Tax=Streptantibioticus parmotrematis TaxID=2873249 RepID=A0ABS7QXD3_9ACTN|nr:TSUP family transporter [Streptantibioticus parmotrematis]MBY8887598.1 TSUP family transporter [Streptantibioticus parmotrematis]